jgi:casein kinase I family protein HRR25
VHLIDFGIARPRLTDNSASSKLPGRISVVGTLPWASLNSHYGFGEILNCSTLKLFTYVLDTGLNPRDDLESLAYTLFNLLLGSLPWSSISVHGTDHGREVQVREKKRAWDGSKLPQCCPAQFGQLLDYSCELKFNDPIDYAHYRAELRRLSEVSADDLCSTSESVILLLYLSDVSLHSDFKPTKLSNNAKHLVQENCPVEVGQLIYVKINARISIEGYSFQALDPWHDPALSSEEWSTVARPAIVLDVNFDTVLSLYKIQVISMGQGTPAKPGKPARKVSGPFSVQSESIVLNPAWPILHVLICIPSRSMVLLPSSSGMAFIPYKDNYKLSCCRCQFMLTGQWNQTAFKFYNKNSASHFR